MRFRHFLQHPHLDFQNLYGILANSGLTCRPVAGWREGTGGSKMAKLLNSLLPRILSKIIPDGVSRGPRAPPDRSRPGHARPTLIPPFAAIPEPRAAARAPVVPASTGRASRPTEKTVGTANCQGYRELLTDMSAPLTLARIQPTDSGPAAQRPSGPAAQRPSGPAAQRPSGPAAQRPSGPAAQRPSGPAAQRPSGPAAQRPSGPAAQRPSGPAAQRPDVRPARGRRGPVGCIDPGRLRTT